MKRLFDWQLTLGIALIALAAAVYYVHFLIFRDLHHIAIYFLGDVAFVFFEVLLVTLVIHRLLHHREQKALRSKLNMLTGAFFSEVGTELLRRFAGFDAEAHRIAERLAVPDDWSEREFLGIREAAGSHGASVSGARSDLGSLKQYLLAKKQFLLDLLQNPSLLETESFTNLVWAVFHLAEELAHRPDLERLPDSDFEHLSEDIRRVYRLLIVGWIDYMKHLKSGYPYLYSLASRTNPFDAASSARTK